MKENWGQGDKGQTSLLEEKVSKDSPIINLMGSIDELGASIGHLMCYLDNFSQLKVQLSEVLVDLYNISSAFAMLKGDYFDYRRVKLIEIWTTELNKELKPLEKFVMPIGNRASTYANVCRTLTRRVERDYFLFARTDSQFSDIGAYLNRLSDYLFVVMRYINSKLELETYY